MEACKFAILLWCGFDECKLACLGKHQNVIARFRVDPADYLFTAAGYRLQEGERSVVVHTELTNRGQVPFQTLPDLYLVLVTPDGETISKAPVSLSSRPPHRIGVAPGETAGGHTVYQVRLEGGAVVEVTGNGFGAPEGQTVRVRLSGQPIATVRP